MGTKKCVVLFLCGLTFFTATAFATVFNVKNYGAVGNGVHDDGPAILATINAVSPYDAIYFPAGTYLYKNSSSKYYTILNGKTRLNVYGDGMNNTILKAYDSTRSSFKIINSDYIVFMDLQVSSPGGSRLAGENASGFYARGQHNVEFHRVKVYNTRSTGITLQGISEAGVWDSEIVSTRADGIHITNNLSTVSSVITIERNTARYTGDDSFSSIGYDGYRNYYIGIKNNTSYDSSASGIAIEGTNYDEIENNYVYRSYKHALRIASENGWPTSGCHEVLVQNNSFIGCRTSTAPQDANW